jgi:hypothetical protein
LPEDSTMIRAVIRLEMVVMVWKVVRVGQSRPWLGGIGPTRA